MSNIAAPRLNESDIGIDNCTVRVNQALDAAGIASGDIPSNMPGSAGERATKDSGYDGKIEIPQNSNLLLSDQQRLKQFEPRSPLPKPGEPGGTPVKTMKMKTKRGE